MILRDYIEGEYRIIEYSNGTVVKQIISKGNPIEEEITIPPSPLEVLKQENIELKQQIEITNQAIAEITMMIATPSE